MAGVSVDEAIQSLSVTIGATVPTGFEHTAAEEVQEKIGAIARISKDRGRIYFEISTVHLHKVHHLKSVDNLFVVVKHYDNYQFKETKEEALLDLQQLAPVLPWDPALEVWKINNSLKKKRGRRRGAGPPKLKTCDASEPVQPQADVAELKEKPEGTCAEQEPNPEGEHDSDIQETEAKPLKFRVTCNRAGDKHSFTSNDAARDFGGAVQEFFQWKADMTRFDVEVLLNIHNNEVVIGIALTEESLHRRNITHFGPTTLRSTLAYGMLRLCKPQMSDIIVDPMCGSGAIPLEGVIEWSNSFFLSGDNNDMAISRTVNNINHILKKKQDGGSISPGLSIDTAQWDLCNLPLKTSSVDIITTDMPFGKRMGSRKRNWDLYPSCLREMARVCRPDTGRAVLLTQDKKCFTKALSRMGGLWRKTHTVWVNVGGLHAGVFVLRRMAALFGSTPEDVREPRMGCVSQDDNIEENVQSSRSE
ncbi:THUMP domain-containing protein 3 [Bagarius yarrelli]|uniref:THUMP domain-containing protein 3 n=1 Tax=Bagarius yarrelli TaxID=175774 RepID=A0A556VXZ1_BAGYA|nr:THUMP domain-containing protein 3 [Bagarius yarrelli]